MIHGARILIVDARLGPIFFARTGQDITPLLVTQPAIAIDFATAITNVEFIRTELATDPTPRLRSREALNLQVLEARRRPRVTKPGLKRHGFQQLARLPGYRATRRR